VVLAMKNLVGLAFERRVDDLPKLRSTKASWMARRDRFIQQIHREISHIVHCSMVLSLSGNEEMSGFDGK
jgi:CHASE1-domain containing sensor protein